MPVTDHKTNPDDLNFEEVLMDGSCFGDWQTDTPKPSNWNTVKSMLQENPVSCTKSEYRGFQKKVYAAQDETEVQASLFPIVRAHGSGPYAEYFSFDNLAPLVPGISDAKPNMFYRSRKSQLKPHIR